MRRLVVATVLMMGLTSTIMGKEEINLQNFKKLLPNITISSINPSAISGIYEVSFKESSYPIYVSKDGNYMIEGQIIDLVKGINLTEQHLNKGNKELISKLDPKEMITYKAPKEQSVVTIFTDVECPYCQVLHRDLKNYHDEGITIRYLAFPRMGIDSKGYKDLVSIWCAEDPHIAMNAAKNKQPVKSLTCKDNPVIRQYELGKQVGISGTPAIILEDGSIIGGYVPAKDLKKMLESKGL